MGGDSGISAFPEEDNIFCWKGTINGSKDTVFEGTQYRLLLSFPNDYPFKPPRSSLRLSAFIPMLNVRGHICLDILQVLYTCTSANVIYIQWCFVSVIIWFDVCLWNQLQDKWSSAYDVRTILLLIQSLLGGKLSVISHWFSLCLLLCEYSLDHEAIVLWNLGLVYVNYRTKHKLTFEPPSSATLEQSRR